MAPATRPGPRGPETAAERRRRLLADRREIGTREVAALLDISRARVAELARHRHRAELLAGIGEPQAQREARLYLRRAAIPATVPPRGRTGYWWLACDIWRWGADTDRLDRVWFTPRALRAGPGRAAGGPPAMPLARATLTELLARLDHVLVTAADTAAWQPVIDDAYGWARRRELPADVAREEAVTAAVEAGCERAVARKLVLQAAVRRARAGQPPTDLARVRVTDLDRAVLMPAVIEAFAAARAAGMVGAGARAHAVAQVARVRGRDPRVVWRVLMEVRDALLT